MGLLEGIKDLKDVKALPPEQLPALCEEIRRRLIDVVSETGGHIGASLGVVELATAIAYVFDSPQDKIVWDVGHQAYTWKLLTGRNDRFPTLRQQGGISGFLRRDESPHDHFGAGHAGTAMSAAFGMAVARDLKGEKHDVVVIVGDGAMTCGLSYEGMNNAGHSGRDLIVVLNDNGMSIAPNVGAISRYLANVATNPLYNRVRDELKHLTLKVDAMVGHGVQDFARRVEESLKNLVLRGVLFQELGLRYFGPVDGHDVAALTDALVKIRQLKGPRLLHVLTQKGKGFPLPADTEKFHARPPYDAATGELKVAASGPPQWTRVFGDAITQLAAEHPELVAITAAMPSGTGTSIFQKKWPDRFFDVGIAEGHATTFAAGLATQGLRPVVAIYSTFLQRAYDNIIHDVAIQKLPVIFCLDRAGMVGDDGQTHMGLYDIAYMLAVPGMTLAAPKDGAEMIGLLRTALAHRDGPFAIRYPRDKAPSEPPPAAEVAAVPYGTWEILRQGKGGLAILPVGAMCTVAMGAAQELAAEGLDVTVVNCRFLKPVDRVLLEALLRDHRTLVTVEDGVVINGFGSYLAEMVQTLSPEVRVIALGAPDRTYEHAPRAKQLEGVGLTVAGIAARIRALHAEEAAPDESRRVAKVSSAPPAGSGPSASTTALSR